MDAQLPVAEKSQLAKGSLAVRLYCLSLLKLVSVIRPVELRTLAASDVNSN